MKLSTKAIALVPAAQAIGQRLALLGLLALLALVGAGMSRVLPASGLAGLQITASNGEIVIGSTIAASNGDVVIGTTFAAPTGGRIAATTGNVHIGNGSLNSTPPNEFGAKGLRPPGPPTRTPPTPNGPASRHEGSGATRQGVMAAGPSRRF